MDIGSRGGSGENRGYVPLDALWRARAIAWMLLTGECVAVVLTLAPGVEGELLRHFGIASIAVQWVLLSTLAALYLTRQWLTRLRPQYVACAAIGWLLVVTLSLSSVAFHIFRDMWELEPRVLSQMQWRLAGIVLTVGFLGLAAFQNHWRGRLHAVRAKQSELQALQARIRPHFLFNTLNTGAALVHQHPEAAERLLLDLADLFRAALAGPRRISLEDELALARRYLEIESLRFGERLQVRWDLPRTMPAVTVPALSIQPLVENAIRHGAERMSRGDVEVTVSTVSDTVVVRISNPLPVPGGPAAPGHRVGLNASQVRIEALTGGRGSVQTEVVDGRFVATVRLPVEP